MDKLEIGPQQQPYPCQEFVNKYYQTEKRPVTWWLWVNVVPDGISYVDKDGIGCVAYRADHRILGIPIPKKFGYMLCNLLKPLSKRGSDERSTAH